MWPVLATLNDLEGRSPVAGLYKCNPSNIYAVFYQIKLTACSRGPSATAGLLVLKLVTSETVAYKIHNCLRSRSGRPH